MILTAAVLLLLSACRGGISEKPPIHPNPNMDTQEKLVPQRGSAFFLNGASMRTPPEGTVARGQLREDQSYFAGKHEDGSWAAMPFTPDEADILRGSERYAIFCSPCHGEHGDGKGVIADPKYKYPIPPTSYHEAQILAMADGNLYDVVTNGVRSMPSYRSQIPVRDRWLIVAHVRVLQGQGATGQSSDQAATKETGGPSGAAVTNTESITTETVQ
ncbi:MAG: cytochrome c [Bacteroidetes bacterium]|nr:cytochrome c [Bacteroidota bacterium]